MAYNVNFFHEVETDPVDPFRTEVVTEEARAYTRKDAANQAFQLVKDDLDEKDSKGLLDTDPEEILSTGYLFDLQSRLSEWSNNPNMVVAVEDPDNAFEYRVDQFYGIAIQEI